MGQLVTLLSAVISLSVVGVLLFYLYYYVNTKKIALEEEATRAGYEDIGTYGRDKNLGKLRALDGSIFFFDDSKSIGLRFLITSLLFMFIAGAFGVIMRVSLVYYNPIITPPIIYNILTTEHATLMIYMFALGSATGLSFYLVPTMLKIKRDNMGPWSSAAYWIWLLGGVFILISRTSTRWYFYPPLALQLAPYGAGPDNWLAVIGLELIFVGISIASAVLLKIIFLDRSESVPLSRMPVFVWGVVFTVIMILSSAPPLMVGLGMLFYDFFNPIFFTASTHSVLLFAVLFWFWGHPIVYIAVIPFFGLFYEVISRFTDAKVYSYTSAVFALGLLMVLSELVWGHHLFNSGLGITWDLFFSTTSFLVVIPSALTVFNWIATLWTANRIRLTTPMLFVINGIMDFVIGGITGVMQSNVGVNEIVHGTYWVTGHFHFIFIGVTMGGTFAAFYILFPTLSAGRVYDERLARWHFYLTAIGSFLMSISWTIGGFLGMPRYVAGYFPFFMPFQDGAVTGGVIIGIGQLIFLYNIAKSWVKQPTTDISNALESRIELPSPEAGGGE